MPEAIQGHIGPDKTREYIEGTDHMLSVMGREGDVKTIWNKSNTDETEHAKKTFDEMKAKGFMAYRVRGDGGKGEAMTEFDPNAEKMIMSPPMQGG